MTWISKLYIFLFLRANICCWYSLEAPRGASNEYTQCMFARRNNNDKQKKKTNKQKNNKKKNKTTTKKKKKKKEN